MKELLQFYDNFDYLFAVIVPIITWLIGFITTKYIIIRKRRKLQRILKLRKVETDIILPIRPGELKLTSNVSATEISNDFVTFEEALSIYDIDRVVQDAGGSCTSLTTQSNNDKTDESNNIFCIGGPLSNSRVARYFREFFPTVKFGCPPNSRYINDHNRESLSNFVFVDDSDDIGTINFTNWTFDFNRKNEGYIILARLMGKNDFGDCGHGTVHICFGNNAITTRAAAKCYSSHREELYRRLKNEGHYFVILKCTNNGIVNFNTFRNVTDEAFYSTTSNDESKTTIGTD